MSVHIHVRLSMIYLVVLKYVSFFAQWLESSQLESELDIDFNVFVSDN